jgi:hypothetical protein
VLTSNFYLLAEQEDILDLAENTFLYMPHCPRWLYEQLLESNKDKIEKMILLSNDLSLYAERYVVGRLSSCPNHILTLFADTLREIRADELKKIPRLRQLGVLHASQPKRSSDFSPLSFR